MNYIKFGGDCLLQGPGAMDYLETLACQRAFIVTSGDVARKCGHLAMVTQRLDKAGVAYQCFEDVEPDPEIANVLEGAEAMRAFGPQWIIALGGGSAIDSAKAMWIAYEHPEFDHIERFLYPNTIPPMRTKARLLCIPTTSGTGSEVTRAVVLSDKKRNLKLPFKDNQLFPDVAILDPAVTVSMPGTLTAYTGLDALTHAVESFTSTIANDFSSAFSKSAFQGMYTYLPLAFEHPDDLTYREKTQNYSTMAGLAFSTVSLGIAHSIAHAVGAVFHVPHGLANAVTLPYVIRYNAAASEAAREKYAILEQLIGSEDLAADVERLKQRLHVPATLAQVCPDREAFLAQTTVMAEMAMKDICTRTNPVPVTAEIMEGLIRQVYCSENEGVTKQ